MRGRRSKYLQEMGEAGVGLGVIIAVFEIISTVVGLAGSISEDVPEEFEPIGLIIGLVIMGAVLTYYAEQ
jgi:hypothetical protein